MNTINDDSIARAQEVLLAAGYHVSPPITPQKRVEAAAGDFCFHAQRLRDLVRDGAPLSDHAEDLIRYAANAIHEARDRAAAKRDAA